MKKILLLKDKLLLDYDEERAASVFEFVFALSKKGIKNCCSLIKSLLGHDNINNQSIKLYLNYTFTFTA